MNNSLKMLIYTYYSSPWKLRSGDDIRVHYIVKTMKDHLKVTTIVYSLSHLADKPAIMIRDRIVYVCIPRKFYRIISKLVKWRHHYDLNTLMKLTNYIDEFITAIKLVNIIRQAKTLYVFGSMTLFSLFIRMLGAKGTTIIYDPLANYAQTLYLRSRHNKIELLRYGLYLALHKLQLKQSNYIVYPSQIDLENAKKTFNLKNTMIIPNPTPICYESIEEYTKLRMKRNDFSKPYFILLAGGKGKGNEEAVKATIKIFSKLPPNIFELYITGPWQDLQEQVRNPNIKICGIVPDYKLKELLAISDYGLAPVFSHVAGTFLKVLAYVAAGLHIVTSPWGLQGIDMEQLREKQIFIVKNIDEYELTITKIVSSPKILRPGSIPPITLCKDAMKINNLSELLKVL